METAECITPRSATVVDGSAQLASPVTVSCQPFDGSPTSKSQEGNVTHSVTYTSERSLSDNLKKPSSFDFAEQIRKLEIEGNKLRAATVSSLSNIGSIAGFNFDVNSNSHESAKYNSANLGCITPLVDISADQKAISDLRTQLDVQRRETERLQKQLLGDLPSFQSISGAALPPVQGSAGHNLSSNSSNSNNLSGSSLFQQAFSPSKAAFSTISSNELAGSSFPRRTYDYQPPSHLERSLKESQEQVVDLRKRLQEASDASDQQKRQFRATVEELKSKLHDTILNRDTVLELRQKESNGQEMLINKLQSSLSQLQEQYKAQEEAFASTTRKLDSHHHTTHVQDTALASMRNLLSEREKQRGRAYFETDPVIGQSPAMLVHSLERCLQDVEHELTVKSYRVTELETELEEQKKSVAEREKSVAREYQEILKREAEDAVRKMGTLTAEHEKKLSEVSESGAGARQRVTDLQRELQEQDQDHQRQLKTKDEVIRELEEKVEDSRTESMQARALWQEKLIEAKHSQVSTERLRQALESSLDEVQKELIETRAEKNELVRQVAVLESRTEDLQSLTDRQGQDLETERERVRSQREREEELRAKVMNLELQATHKQGEMERLERMLEAVKQECSVQVLDKVANVEKLERDRYVDQIQSLSAQLATVTEKCHRANVDHQMSCQEMDTLRSQVMDLTEKLEKARSQMEVALSEKNELMAKIGDNRGDLDRLARDKESYVQQAEQKSLEVTELRVTLDRLRSQLEEKEKTLSTFRQQSSSITQLMEVNTRASDNLREEREKMSAELAERTAAVEELKVTQESLSRKVKAKERRVRELEEETLHVTEQLATKSQELELMQQERDSAMSELRDCRKEMANTVASKDALKKELARVKTLRTKEVCKLQTKLKESEQEFRLSQKALRSKDMVDHKAVRFADKIQKEMTVKRGEMDQLLSRIHRLEEKLEAVNKEKAMVEKDKDSLKKSLAKSLLHTQGLTEELQTTQAQNMELVKRLAALEDEMDKANQKTSAANAQLEKYEQEMATQKLRHQLDLKEAERHGGLVPGVTTVSAMTGSGSSLPSSASVCARAERAERAERVERAGFVGKSDSVSVRSSAPVSVSGDSDVMKNSLEIRDGRHRDYSEVGRELKSLLGEMRSLISGHKEDRLSVHNLSPRDGQKDVLGEKIDRDKNRKKWTSSSPLGIQDLGPAGRVQQYREPQPDTDGNKSWASKSLTDLGDLSDFSLYKEWRPRSRSMSRHQHSLTGDLDTSHNTSVMSRGGYQDVSRLSQSTGSHRKPASGTGGTSLLTVPDTSELCRRLEEKIDSLTRMGGNLQKENREMAELIHLQGEKLDTVKQIERKARENR